MDYDTLVSQIPSEKWQPVSDKMIDLLLASKNDDKMPTHLIRKMLLYWQQNTLKSESGLAVLLEAVTLLEPEKTISFFAESQMANVVEAIKAASRF